MAPNSELRVRFAPSPTGSLHIGGGRTALFNWLYARRHGGTFVLRIEDTDQARSTEESTRGIFESLKWLGLDWDEGPDKGGPYGPYTQTERLATYREHADRLVEEGKAYRCYATKEELDKLRKLAEAKKQTFVYPRLWRDKTPADWLEGKPYVIRFKTPLEGETTFHDEVFGDITTPNDSPSIQDFILLRSDGIPLYNFGAVVDDVLMKISLVARGRDHIGNTTPQVLLYRALGAPLPKFAHLPMMLAPDGKKLSKREGRKYNIPITVTRFVDEVGPLDGYRDLGYSPDALLNYLVRFGWSHGDQEVFSRRELIEHFDVVGINKSDGKFDAKKCLSIDHDHLKSEALTPTERYLELLAPHLEARGLAAGDSPYLRGALATVRERARTFVEAAYMLDYYLRDEPAFEDKGRALLKPEA
ncbi:MAG TPA: glutamate--tRNA ligase, partial [Polyangiaceae bacterium]|nr:glutamate--tRNA ligase [Polyangiaceae bacterium]